jgi:hypothetical protein
VWLTASLVGLGLSLCFWLGLYAVGRILPEGRTKELVSFVPCCVILLQGLRRHRQLSRGGRMALGAALAYMLSPIQLIPNVIPVLGQADDVVVFALAMRCACRSVPRGGVRELWPGTPSSLQRLLGESLPLFADDGGQPAPALFPSVVTMPSADRRESD